MCKTPRAASILSAAVFIIIFISCSTVENNTSGISESTGRDNMKNDPVVRITKPYSEVSLNKSLVQFHEILNSRDYFNQFTWGDYIFEDYLTTIYGLDNGEYEEGEGCEISLYDNEGRVREKVKRSVIEKNGKGEIWWQTEHSREAADPVFYEVLTNRFSVPVSVRFRNAETGKAFSRDTMFGESVRDAMLVMSDAEIRAKLDKERGEEAVNKLLPVYNNMADKGVEIIDAAGKKFEAVRYHGILQEGASGSLDIWYTPEIPQGIIRINMNGSTVAEITGWISGAERQITDETPHELPAYSTGNDEIDPGSVSTYSEGTVSDPVRLDIEEVWEGSVEPAGVSYYSFEVPERGDVELTGLAELYNYGNDYSYNNWISGSEGDELDFQISAAEKGEIIYFSVNDIKDNYSNGERFYIDITINPLLDSSGVIMMNNYRNNPEILKDGKNRIKVSGNDIRYFLYRKKDNGNISIHIENCDSDSEIFSFLTAENSIYSSLGEFEQVDGKKIINLEGIEAGGEIYFYLMRKEGLRNKKITVTVE